MISYGDIPLRIPTPQFAAWLMATMSPETAFAFYRPKMLGTATYNPRPMLNWFLSRGVKINTFFNPWGASRWGIGYFITDHPNLELIREMAYSNDELAPLTLVIDDDHDNSMETELYMLPAVPLSNPPLDDDDPAVKHYLLVLVDERFFWWEKAATVSITEGTTTWAQLYSSIATSLDITLEVDTIPAAYLKPSIGFSRNYEHLPMLLDVAAASVGQRIVRTLEGEFFARNATSALEIVSEQAQEYVRVAGGNLALGIQDAGDEPDA